MNKMNFSTKLFLLIFVIPLVLISCKETENESENLKYFLSLDYFNNLQESFDSCELKSLDYNNFQDISFDTLYNFEQVENLIHCICDTNDFIYGFIPLNYKYKGNNFFLSTFPFNCDKLTHRDYIYRILTIDIYSNYYEVSVNNKKLRNNEPTLSDSLNFFFNESFEPFFKKSFEIYNSTNKEIEKVRLSKDFGICIILRIDDNENLQKLKMPIDLVLESFINTLNSNLEYVYKKKLNELNNDELVFFTNHLFLRFEITRN